MILCVVDATTAAFDTSVALKLIRKAGKLSNTIVAMTKSDLVYQEEEYVPKIFDRVLGQSSDNEHLRQLAGCVAVANLHDRSDISQTDGDAAERQIFNRMLHDPAEAFASPEIQHRLKNNITVMQLIVQLDRMFHSYIVQHWRPAALHKVEAKHRIKRGFLNILGPPVEELTADGALNAVLSQVNFYINCLHGLRKCFA